MAQSNNVTDAADYEFERETLPEGESRLAIRRADVTITIEGEEAAVRDALTEQFPEADLDVAELPIPDGDDGLVSAETFYAA